MKLPTPVALYHVPSGLDAEAVVVALTDGLIERWMGAAWWEDPAIDQDAAASEIDRHWDWLGLSIDRDGRPLRDRKLAVVTGDGAVQGAMMVSAEAVACERAGSEGEPALFVELLFAAPRNRYWVRRDRTELYRGVGLHLLRSAAEFSLSAGLGGRLKLEASPGFVEWYEKRGLLVVGGHRIIHEGVEYTPMELESGRVSVLLPDRMKGTRRGRKPS